MVNHILAICFDFGDTLADESTEVKDDTLTTLRAELIPGAGEVVRELKRRSYKLALVADGRPGTYHNVLTQHGLYDLFGAFSISEQVGVDKPDPRMFIHALDQLGIAQEDYGRTVMVGNHLERDVKGANDVGMVSVWLDWAPRRSKVPADESEVPQHTIKMPLELLPLIESLERERETGGEQRFCGQPEKKSQIMSKTSNATLSSLFDVSQNTSEQALAARYAPVIRFDAHEPFLPLAAGYTIFRHSGLSPSFKQGHEIDLTPEGQPPASLAIEYAIWWDWDIGHLYELEHAWVFVDEEGKVVRGEASWHGRFHDMRHDGRLALAGDHLVLYSEPGKHAFAPTPEWFRERRQRFKRSETSLLAGCAGVLMTRYLEGRVTRTPFKNLLVRSYLAQKAFEPSWDLSQVFEFEPDMLIPWPALADWIPIRVNDWLDKLAGEIPISSYRFLRIGHRGAAAHAPGNTLASLRKAAELGADMVEFDIRQTADHQTVLMHDSYLTDAEGRVWPVHRSTLAELQVIDLGGGERVPTLAEAIEVCRTEQLGAYIELKEGSVIPAVVSAIHEYDLAAYSIAGSFRPDWLADLKAAVPEIETSILFSSPHLDAVKLAQSIGATYVHPCWKQHPNPSGLLTSAWVARVREAGLGIICWNEERPEEIAALRQVGVDGICSDAPELLQG